MTHDKLNNLISVAKKARLMACAPCSGFKVGAAVETKDGRIYTGCNIENASNLVTCCAERVALYKAVSDGAREFVRVAIVAGTPGPCPPCGICRQVLYEFSPDIEVIMAGTKGRVMRTSLKNLLPRAFRRGGGL